jgi:hypothetical protein
MSTSREPAELLNILVILLVAVRKLNPPLTDLLFLFSLWLLFLGNTRLFSTADWESHKKFKNKVGDSKEIRAGNIPLVFRQTQPSCIQVWLHIAVQKPSSGQHYKTFLNKI